MSDDNKKNPDSEIITRLRIPDEMIIDPDKPQAMKTKRKKKAAEADQVLVLLSILLMAVGGMYVLQSYSDAFNWGAHWAGGASAVRTRPDLTNISVILFAGSVLLCLVGLPVYFRKKKKPGPGAVFFMAGAAVSLAAMIALLVV